jgi:RNA polymerase sigma factor (TIGR02999 family)
MQNPDDGSADEPLDGSSVLTQLLRGASPRRSAALDQLFERLYRELRAIARQELRRSATPNGLSTTVLVHEAYLRFASSDSLQPDDRQYFLAYASTVMRSVIVDVLRAERAGKRGGGERPLTLNTDVAERVHESADETLGIHDALLDLAAIDQQLVKIVEMRFFAGLSNEEIADSLKLSVRTVRRNWQKARLFLYAQLQGRVNSD